MLSKTQRASRLVQWPRFGLACLLSAGAFYVIKADNRLNSKLVKPWKHPIKAHLKQVPALSFINWSSGYFLIEKSNKTSERKITWGQQFFICACIPLENSLKIIRPDGGTNEYSSIWFFPQNLNPVAEMAVVKNTTLSTLSSSRMFTGCCCCRVLRVLCSSAWRSFISAGNAASTGWVWLCARVSWLWLTWLNKRTKTKPHI